MALIIGSARHDENGTYSGGRNGDQDGTEVSTQTYYVHKKGWQLVRAKDAAKQGKEAGDICSNADGPPVPIEDTPEGDVVER